jgi:hypothetical protein
VKGIEPSYSAWKAAALPLSYTRIFFDPGQETLSCPKATNIHWSGQTAPALFFLSNDYFVHISFPDRPNLIAQINHPPYPVHFQRPSQKLAVLMRPSQASSLCNKIARPLKRSQGTDFAVEI